MSYFQMNAKYTYTEISIFIHWPKCIGFPLTNNITCNLYIFHNTKVTIASHSHTITRVKFLLESLFQYFFETEWIEWNAVTIVEFTLKFHPERNRKHYQ